MFIKPPEEDDAPGMCGVLRKAMYGTRDAAQNWEVEYNKFLKSIGFKRGTSSPCAFCHEEKNSRLVGHGDDFTILEHEGNLNWFR